MGKKYNAYESAGSLQSLLILEGVILSFSLIMSWVSCPESYDSFLYFEIVFLIFFILTASFKMFHYFRLNAFYHCHIFRWFWISLLCGILFWIISSQMSFFLLFSFELSPSSLIYQIIAISVNTLFSTIFLLTKLIVNYKFILVAENIIHSLTSTNYRPTMIKSYIILFTSSLFINVISAKTQNNILLNSITILQFIMFGQFIFVLRKSLLSAAKEYIPETKKGNTHENN